MARADFPHPYTKVNWRGGTCDAIDKVAFEVLEATVHATATIYQLGYNPGGVDASAGAHDGGGAFDYWFPDLNVARVVHKSRDIGLDAWYRYPPTFPTHVHAIRHGSKTASPVAKGQMTDYVNHGNGLVPLGNHDDPSYRPTPIALFTVDDYYTELERRKKEKRLRGALVRFTRNIKHLTRRKAAVRKQLAKLNGAS